MAFESPPGIGVTDGADRARQVRGHDRIGAWIRLERTWLAVALAALVALGAVLANDYGQSWDVTRTARLGRITLRSYSTGVGPTPSDHLGDMARHGPAAAAAEEWLTQLLAPLRPSSAEYQIRSFVFFLFFVIAIGCVYGLARRWIAPGPAFLAAALFGSQPLLFGHAFINPFDGPFLALFCACMFMGFRLADGVDPTSSPKATAWADLWRDWKDSRGPDRRWFPVWLFLFCAAAAELFFLNALVLPALNRVVAGAYFGRSWPLINALFRLVAEDASRAPVEAYIRRMGTFYSAGRLIFLAVLAVFLLACLRRVQPSLFGSLSEFRSWRIAIPAGLLLGILCAVRPMGPLAGVLASFLALARGKYRALGPLLVYWGVALLAFYLGWPSLWNSPGLVLHGFLTRTVFEPFVGKILFEGRIWEARDLPWRYLSSMLALQTTLPALGLGVAGVGIWLQGTAQGQRKREWLAIGLWLLVPIAAAAVLGLAQYDNGRHFLFVLPPVFLFSGLAIQRLETWIRPAVARYAFLGVLLLPGLAGILRLHPYEYIYFGELAGGVGGAFRRYELDYWALSYREAMDYVNRTASPGARINVATAKELFAVYARPDLQLYLSPEEGPAAQTPELGVASTRANADLGFEGAFPVVFRVVVDGAVLAIVKDLH